VLMFLHDTGVTAEHALLLTLVAVSLVAPARTFVWDWLPFLGVWVMFDDLGAMIDARAVLPHVTAPIIAERGLLGGNVGTVWLQLHLRPAAPWLDVPLALEYLTFFAAPILFGLWLWLRHQSRFSAFVAAYIAMMAIGFVVYVLYPETPPWLASQEGFLRGVSRVTVSLLDHIGIGSLYGGADPAPNGAMPSLHVAVPTLVAFTAAGIRGWKRWTSWLWFFYPLTMGFATVYLGEHYLLDCAAGIALGAVCFTGTVLWSALAAHRSVRPVLGRAA
jgi:membrane-associated phospholipid phosphatase